LTAVAGTPTHVMIVAHPDDETLFGGQELLNGDAWHVVCLTNCGNIARANRFRLAMAFAGATCDIWDYPDRPGWSRDAASAESAWQPLLGALKERLTGVLTCRTPRRVVTHNRDGEYGHIHHKMVHEIVRNLADPARIEVFAVANRELPPSLLELKLGMIALYGDFITKTEIAKLSEWIRKGTTAPFSSP